MSIKLMCVKHSKSIRIHRGYAMIALVYVAKVINTIAWLVKPFIPRPMYT